MKIPLKPEYNLFAIVLIDRFLKIDLSVVYLSACIGFYVFYRWCWFNGALKYNFRK